MKSIVKIDEAFQPFIILQYCCSLTIGGEAYLSGLRILGIILFRTAYCKQLS